MSDAYLINEDRWDDADPFRDLDNAILRKESGESAPIHRIADQVTYLQQQVVGLQALLELAGEDRFWLVAEIARLNAQLGQTTYQTRKTP